MLFYYEGWWFQYNQEIVCPCTKNLFIRICSGNRCCTAFWLSSKINLLLKKNRLPLRIVQRLRIELMTFYFIKIFFVKLYSKIHSRINACYFCMQKKLNFLRLENFNVKSMFHPYAYRRKFEIMYVAFFKSFHLKSRVSNVFYVAILPTIHSN